MTIYTIDAREFSSLVKDKKDLNILDVRTGVECRAEKLACNFIHIPLHKLDPVKFVSANRNALGENALYILCRSGGRARKAAESLENAGLHNLVIVQGGLGACAACDIPVEKGNVWPLERQVRLAAGLLVLSGVLLGHFANDAFFILPGFVGAGLVLAAVTDWCGMAMLLARAPWNNVDSTKEIQKSIQYFESKT